MAESRDFLCLIPGCARGNVPFTKRGNLRRHLKDVQHGLDANCIHCTNSYNDALGYRPIYYYLII